MSLPDLTRADYVAPPPVPAAGMTDLDALLGISTAGVGEVEVPADTREAFGRALRFGVFHAAIGCGLFALVGHWVMLGLVSIVVGILVGNGMMRGSGGVGGRKYQWAAVLLTYFAVSFASTLDLFWALAQKGHGPGEYFARHPILVILYALLGPFMELLVRFGYGLLGLAILFFGLQAAWKTARGGPEAVVMARKMDERRSPLDGGPSDGSTLGLR